MSDSQAVLTAIQSQANALHSFGVSKIGVFGSVARNEATAKSDIDVIVDFASGRKTYRNFIGTVNFLEQLLGRPIDALTFGSISPYLKPYIEKDIRYAQI